MDNLRYKVHVGEYENISSGEPTRDTIVEYTLTECAGSIINRIYAWSIRGGT